MDERTRKLFERGGSGRGASYYTQGALCPRKLRLDKEVEQQHDASTLRRDVGTIFHDLADLYHSGQHTEELVYEDSSSEEAIAEAQRLFVWYSDNFPMDAWGAVVGTEVQMPPPEDEEAAKKIRALFGVEFTGRADLVTLVDEHIAAKIQARSGLLLAPGYYIVDHKTKARRDSDMHFKYKNSVQFRGYPILWDLLHPKMPCQGMIANVIVGHQELELEKSHCAVLVPKITEPEYEKLFTFLQNAERLIATDFANQAACDVHGICPHLISGRCTG